MGVLFVTTRLDRLLRPKSVAVIGGGAFGTNVVEQCLKMNYAGALWPVHPSRPDVHGVPAFKSVADLPAPPDAAFVAVNRNLTIDIIRQLSAMGAGGAICFAAGFRETGGYDADGDRLQRDLVEAAGPMPIIGPNCYGLINYADGALLWPDQHGGRRLGEGERGVAIITQSSNIACNLTMQQRGLPIAFLMTAGNQAQTGLSEMALGLIEDDRVTALGLHIEGFDSVAGFERLATRAREGDTDLAGPQQERLVDQVRELVRRSGEDVEVVAIDAPPSMAGGSMLPGPEALVRGPSFAEWLDAGR